ncbi:MAG: ABC transporter permease [Mycobacteriales bacterium]
MRRVLGFFGGLWRKPKLFIGLVLLLLVVLFGALHTPIVHWIGHGTDPMSIGFGGRWEQPSSTHLLGTDAVGRDVLALLVTGLWTSLKIGLLAGVLSTVIGVIVAFYAAYRGGWLDNVLATVTDLFLVIPSFPLLIAFSGFAKKVSLFEIGVILAVFSWAGAARVIRSQVLSLRTRPYIDLARVTKSRDFEIITTELLPNMLPYIALGLALAAIGSIFGLVGLELIGLGPSGLVDLGLLINTAVTGGALSLGAWPIFVAPIGLITILFFALNLINVGLDEAYNPRLRKVAGA